MGRILTEYRDKIVNTHLSILPSFSGFHSFDSALDYGVKMIGSTIHFIDETADGGKVIFRRTVESSA
jgi:phosphoribosylglycinamide formyltransferase-1